MVKKILFICKYNRFRSKFAEAYFNSINKNKDIEVSSAGIVEVNVPMKSDEKRRNKYILEKFCIPLSEKSRGINVKLLEVQDEIIIVADDVPKIIFDNPAWRDKVVVWRIADVFGDDKEKINKTLGAIKRRVDALVNRLRK
ncbi:MAG: hypothetical protein V1889_00260 [archaeon]